MMSKLRLLVLLIILGCVVFLISHISVVYNQKNVRLINSVHVHNDNFFKVLGNKQNKIDKDNNNGNNENIEPEKGRLETQMEEEDKKGKENKLDNNSDDAKQKPIVNIKVEETSNKAKPEDTKDTESTKKVEEDPKALPSGSAQEPKETVKNEIKKENVSNNKQAQNNLPDCSKRGDNLVGPLFIDQTKPKDIQEVEKLLSVEYGGTVEKGGWWEPTTCKPLVKVAIIIPYRNRFEQLKIFLRHLHPMLQRQKLYYRIIVVEMLEDDPFNRAGLFNIGFVESLKLGNFDCFVFTDVDLLPEDDRNYYGCPTSPRHMSVGVNTFNYVLPYATIFGGVGAFTKEHFETINGMSNMFWGWGGEDDDLYARITQAGYKLTRPSLQVGRYTMIKVNHFRSSDADPNRMNLLRNSRERMYMDGLNTLHYELKEVEEAPLVTFVKIVMRKSHYIAR